MVGPGHARVQIAADFDFNRITQTSDKYDPDGRVVRSSQTREEEDTSGHTKTGGAVSVSNELPGTGAGAAGANTGDRTHKTEEVINYEISRTTKTEIIEPGRLNRISAAVLVDGIYTKNAKGEMVYQPRSKQEIDRIAALVRSAIGFNAKRGDQVEVVNLRFAEPTPIPIDQPTGWMAKFNFTKDDIMRAADLGVMGLLGLLVLLLVVRPLVRRIITPDDPSKAARAGAAGVAGALGVQENNANSGPNVSIVASEEKVAISNRTSEMIDIAQVQGQVHAQSVQKVGELADQNPHETVAIIRSWLHEDAA